MACAFGVSPIRQSTLWIDKAEKIEIHILFGEIFRIFQNYKWRLSSLKQGELTVIKFHKLKVI